MTRPVETVDAGPRQVCRRVLVAAPATELFQLVADPHRHHELDGSGTVADGAVKGPHYLNLGARFTVSMRQYGVPYRIRSKVTAFEVSSLIEWQHPFGHRWRYEFFEQAPGATWVTETFDYRSAWVPVALELARIPATNAGGITRTLQRLAARYA